MNRHSLRSLEPPGEGELSPDFLGREVGQMAAAHWAFYQKRCHSHRTPRRKRGTMIHGFEARPILEVEDSYDTGSA
jgi:hypothetical protein